MSEPSARLPDDPAALKAMVAAREAEIDRLHQIMRELQRHRFGWRIAALDAKFAEQARINEHARRLTTIQGIGALNATTLVTAIGDMASFARGRDLAAWLGLVLRQVTTGEKPWLVGIAKRGSKYLRKTLVQGARPALSSPSLSDTHLGQWLRGLLARSHVNTAVFALAAKMARIVWALLRHGRVYEPGVVAA